MAERRKLTTNPLTSTEGVALQVDDVYVPLGLIERKKQSKRQGDISPEQGSELYKETEITKTFEYCAFLKQVLKQKNTPKSQGKRIAIIGEPGAGKTTLLQQIADWVSRKIHQSIVIWVSLADLRDKELKSYLFETWLTQVAEKTGKAEATKQLKDDFVALFNQNNVWLLLDGLDEMSGSNPLTEIARQLREARLISQARIVLTCRVNLWDAGINALDDFDTYRTLNFSYPQQVERFIYKWFVAIPETGKHLCTVLKESGKERIRDLVKNPLRLTLLCLNWQSGDGKLPDTQAGLYQQFVDDFYKWKKEEFTTNPDQRQQLNVKLGELAKAAIDKEATRFRLRQDFVNQFLGYIDDENSLLKLALNRGWLNCVGIDTNRKPVYAFFHASFQEYFAAIAIDDWHFFLNHVPKNPSQGIYRIFEPQWKQTILLWLGRPEENLKQQKQQFIYSLVNFEDGCGKYKVFTGKGFYEYQAYFLAAIGIAEFSDCFRADKIVEQIVNWTIGGLSSIQEEAKSALKQTDRTKAIALLLQLLQSTDALEVNRIQAAEKLGQIDPGNKNAITTLLQQLHSTDEYYEIIRWLAAKSLGKIGIGDEKAIAALVQLLQSSDLHQEIYIQAATSLVQIDPGNKNAIAALVQLLQSTNLDADTRRRAGYSLWEIGTSDKNIIITLTQLLQSTNLDEDSRRLVSYILQEIVTGNQNVIVALTQLLQSTDVDQEIHGLAAHWLWEINTSNKNKIAALSQLLQSTDINEETRKLVAYNLGQIDPGNSQAITTLSQLLQSTDINEETRRLVAYNLGQIDPGNSQAITTLSQLLQSTDINEETRRLVAYDLGQIDSGNLQAITTLVQLLQSTDVDEGKRIITAESLGRILRDNNSRFAVVKTLSSSLLLGDVEYDVVWNCAQNMPYPDFYQAWHQHNFVTRAMQSLKKILFTRII
ncbi:HEAT repeat domain-containing protein [Nostoc sp. C057]|uniref:HEAT repeat domain-containing protein n=1 Tax=Nostoc sp. C057 TaxID=2576903 RepID=UPI002118E292|nr:HEAT repeat domain-containing protein [Nostoc sp. C057]